MAFFSIMRVQSAAKRSSRERSPVQSLPSRWGCKAKLFLGNLNAVRDWGHARDYVEGMWLILQQEEPDDYVLATGEAHSVREFVEKAFAQVGRTGGSKRRASIGVRERYLSRSIRDISARRRSIA